jgi:phenylpyruvate tautomerase PptA (4-oxalocrotonate tautomerase family)
MPLWKIYHPVGAYSAQDKKEFAEKVTAMYSWIPIPKSYVVMIFEEVAADSFYVGGASHCKFVRRKLEHMARTLPGLTIREWWVKAVDQLIAPYVKDRGYDWEVTIDEVPADLWSLQGEIPPPFESHAEKRQDAAPILGQRRRQNRGQPEGDAVQQSAVHGGRPGSPRNRGRRFTHCRSGASYRCNHINQKCHPTVIRHTAI